MSLPDLQAVKDRLRIEHDEEDDDLNLMRASARAQIEESIGRPIESVERTFVIECRGTPRYYADGGAFSTGYQTSFFLPLYPVLHEEDSSGGGLVTITDADGEDVTDFRVNPVTGHIIATGSGNFGNFPYTVTATVGLDLMAGYDTRVEPKLAQAMLDLCADWYQRRNPGALAEGAGGGVITQWQTLGVPERICKQLEAYRLAKAL